LPIALIELERLSTSSPVALKLEPIFLVAASVVLAVLRT
jgi:hypothetical protein